MADLLSNASTPTWLQIPQHGLVRPRIFMGYNDLLLCAAPPSAPTYVPYRIQDPPPTRLLSTEHQVLTGVPCPSCCFGSCPKGRRCHAGVATGALALSHDRLKRSVRRIKDWGKGGMTPMGNRKHERQRHLVCLLPG